MQNSAISATARVDLLPVGTLSSYNLEKILDDLFLVLQNNRPGIPLWHIAKRSKCKVGLLHSCLCGIL